MSKSMLNDALSICQSAVASCRPEEGVKKALKDLNINEEVILVAVGKASFAMAKAASETVKVKEGIVITKYGHSEGELENIRVYEASHPVLDENGIRATEEVLKMCEDLSENDTVLFLLSGGASSLFESPLIPLQELQEINEELLRSGMDIEGMNTIRKKLSKVKGGRFADHCKPAKVCSIILSDVLSDRLDTIGSGPTAADETSSKDALDLIDAYHIQISDETRKQIVASDPALAENSENHIIGSVRILCKEAMKEAEKLGYHPVLINDHIDIDAVEAGNLLFEEAMKYRGRDEDICLVIGGETYVRVKGNGLGGRNQEMAFSQFEHLSGIDDVLIMALASDGTDGPTDAAGGYADGSSYEALKAAGGDFEAILADNDSYHGLQMSDRLIITGPTGTNVNDVAIALICNRK